MPMAVQTIEVNGAELTCLEEGTGDPVVLLHGTLGDYRTWRRQVDQFRSKYWIIALSQRYYWPNKWPDDGTGYGVRTHVAQPFSDSFTFHQLHLIGHSYGGYVAAQLAVEHRELVCTLVLAEPALASLAVELPEMPRLMAEFAQNRKAAFDDWQTGDRTKAVEEHLAYVFGIESLNRIRDEHYGVMRRMAQLSAPHIACAHLRRRSRPSRRKA
jgi:pimeloyl-ACP methyl ester carboxylesterase